MIWLLIFVFLYYSNKPNPAAISGKVNGVDGQVSGRACESCYAANSSQWYSWGPAHMQCRLCSSCWIYWKKYGGLKMPTRLGRCLIVLPLCSNPIQNKCGLKYVFLSHLSISIV